MPGLYNIRDHAGRFVRNESGLHIMKITQADQWGIRFYKGRISKRDPRRRIIALDLQTFRIYYAWRQN